MTRHVLSLLDLGADGLRAVLQRAKFLKSVRGKAEHPQTLKGKSVAVLLEKASTRTRISFEVGIQELGGHPLVLAARDLQLGRGETIEDTGRMFSRYVHAVVYRTSEHERVQALADACSIPVINGLSDLLHPCQLLADLMTMEEEWGSCEGRKVAWLGDGNNVDHSWILAAALMNFELVLACPQGFEPEAEVLALGRKTGRAKIEVVSRPEEALQGAHVVVTDVWASMGQEAETEARKKALAAYAVDAAGMRKAASDAIFLHCLPAHRGEEVDAAVIDGPQSRVWNEAENRLHTQKALLEWVLDA